MKCDAYEEQVSAMIDNELADDASEQLFVHLAGCAACRSALRAGLELRSNLKEEVPLVAPKELDDKVLRTLVLADRQDASPRIVRRIVWQRSVSMPWPLAAAIAGLFLVGGLAVTSVWSPFSKTPTVPQVCTVYITALPTVEVTGYYP